jgi:hypothetical protein
MVGDCDRCSRRLAGKCPILDLTLCARPNANHIAHFRKMVGHGVAAFGAGFFGLFNHRLEVAEVEVFEHTGKQKAKG